MHPRGGVSSQGLSPRRRAVHIGVAAFLLGLTAGGLLRGHVTSDGGSGHTHSAVARRSHTARASVSERDAVPTGFANTEDGAVASAAAFVTSGQRLLDMDPLAAEKAVREMSAAASADAQVKEIVGKLASAREVLAPGTGPIVYRQSAIAWKLEGFTPSRTRVAIWSVSVLSRDGVAPPQTGWSISTLDLLWERGDWRVWSETISAGPAPTLDDSTEPATSAQLDAALMGFTDFGVAL